MNALEKKGWNPGITEFFLWDIEELTVLIFHYLSRRMKEENPDLVTLAFVMGTSLKGNETIGTFWHFISL